MAYCRPSDSDIYLYPSSDGIVCCVCRFAPLVNTIFTTGGDFFGIQVPACTQCNGEGCIDCQARSSTFLDGAAEAMEHVAKHRAAGDYVPSYVDDQLREEKEELRNQGSGVRGQD